jgi:mannose-6-phosphate isomerase-like protein (cupin superfamily)
MGALSIPMDPSGNIGDGARVDGAARAYAGAMSPNDSFPTQVDLLAAAAALAEHWSPRVVARVNDQYVKVAKVKGELAWHAHDAEDELFLILAGRLRIEYRDRPAVELAAGALHVVPRGVLHNPVAEEECLIALVETVTTKHTGDVVVAGRTRSLAEQLGR